MFQDIKNRDEWAIIEKISKGWSADQKYFIKTIDGRSLLLRVSDIGLSAAKKKEYDMITKYAKLHIPMSEPVDFGVCNQGKNIYMLLTWVDGKDLEEVLAYLPEEEQYRLGREAGVILKKIHSIEVTKEDWPKETKKAKKLLQLSRYEESKVRIAHDEAAIQYVKENIGRIGTKKPVYMHGDFHPGNLIYRRDGSIGVIDFNRWEAGDPYEEFYKLESFGIEHSIPYCIGQIDAYFDNHIPHDFWRAHAVYTAHASLYSINWAEKFGQKDIDRMVKRCRMAFENYDGFHTYIPKWYSDQYRKSLPVSLSRRVWEFPNK